MKLEPIDTSTTAGKARVMQLAAEGRRVAVRFSHHGASWRVVEPGQQPLWHWGSADYAIIAQPVGPDEVWVVITERGDADSVWHQQGSAESAAANSGSTAVRYRRVEE